MIQKCKLQNVTKEIIQNQVGQVVVHLIINAISLFKSAYTPNRTSAAVRIQKGKSSIQNLKKESTKLKFSSKKVQNHGKVQANKDRNTSKSTSEFVFHESSEDSD